MTAAVHVNTVNSILECVGEILLEFDQNFRSNLFFHLRMSSDPHTSNGLEKDQLLFPVLIFCDSHPIYKKNVPA